jgi:hypothetical protein
MQSKCILCGCTEAESVADSKTLGLHEELQNGVYSCCQITAWAHEQWLAWIEATNEDSSCGCGETVGTDYTDGDAVLVPVRFRHPVPWFRRT